MLASIEKEVRLTAKDAPFLPGIETIYFGGGTPSILLPAEIAQLLNTIQLVFPTNAAAEISLETNPDDVTDANLLQWKKAGVNRLSLGVQSFNEAELQWMNRAHNTTESLGSIDKIIAAGFHNFSVDLIYGSPLLSNEDFGKNIETILSKNIPHVSAYALTVEPKTVLDAHIKNRKSPPIDEGRQAEQFDMLVEKMTLAGYEQYEISNFAKPGFRSRHNSSYWQGKPYFGFGPSAHSYDGYNKRRWNIANNALYIKSLEQDTVPFEEEILTTTQQLNERIMISLRTMEGLDCEGIARDFGDEQVTAILQKAMVYLQQNKLTLTDWNLRLTDTGKFFADGIAADLFF